jgi:hypothetical protein
MATGDGTHKLPIKAELRKVLGRPARPGNRHPDVNLAEPRKAPRPRFA